MELPTIADSIRIYRRSLKVKRIGIKQYDGSDKEICRQIIENCWNKKEHYFMASYGHFNQFWSRDLGLCAEHLVHLGYRDQVQKSLEYALKRFKAAGRITTTISAGGKPYNFPTYAPDSLAYILLSLKVSHSKWLVEQYKPFLEEQIDFFFSSVIDQKTGLVRKDRHFSSMKDQSIRVSSCYDNVMAAMVKALCNDLSLHNPFGNCCTKEKIKKAFWKGYFIDDLSGKNVASGDANTFPYWTGLFNEKSMINSSILKIQKLGLDKPFPLRYTTDADQRMIIFSVFSSNYEGNSVWVLLGGAYLSVVRKADKKRFAKYAQEYRLWIEKYKNYLEVFNPDGTPYKSPFYYCDESMLWASMYLDMVS